MRLIVAFFRRYSVMSLLTLVAMLFAGLAEGFGISMLLPLLEIATDAHGGPTVLARDPDSFLEKLLTGFFETLGIAPSIPVLLMLFVSGIVLKAALVLLANKRVGYTVAQVATDLRLSLIRALFATRWAYFVHQPIGRFTNAVATEANRSADAYLFGIRAIALLVHATVYSVVALMLDWKATLIALAAGTLVLYALRRLVSAAREAGKRQTRLLTSLLSLMTDTLQSIKPLKAMAREYVAEAVLRSETQNLYQALKKQVFSKEALRALQEPLITIFFAFGLYVALVGWQLPLATILVMVFLLAKVLITLQKSQKEYQKLMIAESAYWSLRSKIEEAQQEQETCSGATAPVFDREIRLDGVSFSYERDWVLDNVQLVFPRGSISAIIGHSGAGKTTIIDLIIGLLSPQKGTVRIDDIPLTDLDVRQWRRLIGYVPQETLLLHETVWNNVTLGDPAFTEMDVERALRDAGARDFVADMPKGVHSVVGERGSRLSGGQRQRISIARALVHRPQLLILDEATSSLDPASETAICETLLQLRGKLTTLAISHQPALLDAADRAYRLHKGIVRPVGDWETRGAAGLGSNRPRTITVPIKP